MTDEKNGFCNLNYSQLSTVQKWGNVTVLLCFHLNVNW